MVCLVGYGDFTGLYVELFDDLGDIQFEVHPFLFQFGVDLVAVAFGYFHPAFSYAPVQYRYAYAQCHQLLVHRIAVGFFQLFVALRQAELCIESSFKTPVGFCFGNGTFTLQPAAFEGADIRIVLECKLHGCVYIDCEVRNAVVGDHR